jgi:ubiquinone/menaquinone biosynthesis C-methylase UbiE
MDPESLERKRIQDEYCRRDTSGWLNQIYSHQNPAFLFHIQEREWALVRTLRRHGFHWAGSRILEVGCGSGHILERFREFGVAQCFGIDLLANRIKQGKHQYPHLSLSVADGLSLPFPDDSFDCVMQFMCLSSILSPPMREKMAREMWRVLRPGGCLLCYDFRPVSLSLRCSYKIRSLYKKLHRREKSLQPAAQTAYESYQTAATPLAPITLPEIKHWWGNGEMEISRLSLDFHLAEVARHSKLLAELLGVFPCLRTHHLVLAKKKEKPGETGQ